MATPEKNLALPAFNSLGWNTPLNTNFSQIDVSLAGIQPINLAAYVGGPVVLTNTFPIVSTPLTALSYLPLMLFCFGALAQNTVVQIPSGITGVWIFQNLCSGPYTLTLASGGGGASYIVPQGITGTFISDGTNVIPAGATAQANQIGDIITSASGSSTRPLCLLCYGQAVSRTTYALLFAVIGTAYGAGDGSTTFNIPDYRGRVLAGADNMGGVAAGRLSGYTTGAAGGSQTTVLSVAQLAGHSHFDAGHSHAITDLQHNHSYPAWTCGIVSGGSNQYFAPADAGFSDRLGFTNPSYTGITGTQVSYASITFTGSSAPVPLVQPTQAVNVFIYAGV